LLKEKIMPKDDYEKFEIPGIVKVKQWAGNMPILHIHGAGSECDIHSYGAHVASFRPKDRGELLWMSPYNTFQAGKPIRGGIPLCFPWFGKHHSRNDLPLHGFARTKEWNILTASELSDGRTRVVFGFADDEETRAVWPHQFGLELSVTVGEALDISLRIENRGAEAFECEDAFHTYFRVDNLNTCEVRGLDGFEYIDRVRGDARAVQKGILRFEGETVNAYMRAPAVCELADLAANHRICCVEQRNMNAVVVWNPGATAGQANPEIRETWNQFVCVESANCLDRGLKLAPGEVHTNEVRISVRENP
jgi:D-hexose-6-phosphate mutarotase